MIKIGINSNAVGTNAMLAMHSFELIYDPYLYLSNGKIFKSFDVYMIFDGGHDTVAETCNFFRNKNNWYKKIS